MSKRDLPKARKTRKVRTVKRDLLLSKETYKRDLPKARKTRKVRRTRSCFREVAPESSSNSDTRTINESKTNLRLGFRV